MIFEQHHFSIETNGRGTIDITARLAALVSKSTIKQGVCQVFLRHTSASLIFCENADPVVREDLERFMARLVKDGDPLFLHTDEGPDDMPSHIRTILTQNSLSIPIEQAKLSLGTWQGVYLWEHRKNGHKRQFVISLWGDL